MKNKKILIFILSVFVINTAMAAELDVLIAKTAIALGDEYSKLASKQQNIILEILEDHPNLLVETKSTNQDGKDDDYDTAKSLYENYKSLALAEYEQVYCDSNCVDVDTVLELSENFNYLEREAFTKYELLLQGLDNSGKVGRFASVYAVNSNFEEHLLGRLSRLVDNQQRFDTEARRMKKIFSDLEGAQIDVDGEIIGADSALLNARNYSLDNQTQISSFNSCVETNATEKKFEINEYQKAVAQYELLQKNIKSNIDKIYDFTFDIPGADKVFTVFANLGWQNSGVGFSTGDKVYINSDGKWNVKGAASIYTKGDLYNGGSSLRTTGFFKKIFKAAVAVTNPSAFLAYTFGKKLVEKHHELAEKEIDEDDTIPFSRIVNKGLEATSEGYYFSFSNSLGSSSGDSRGSSGNAGVSFFGLVSLGGGVSQGTSAGESKGIGSGGTYGLKLTTTVMQDAAVGSLIGSFCEVEPTPASGCELFVVGKGTMLEIDPGIGSKTLWLRANDHETLFTNNSGSAQVKIQKNTTFQSAYDDYIAWGERECDSEGYNCGFEAILENIAYVPDPFLTIQASFNKEFPDMAPKAKEILLQEMNYLVELKILGKDLKAREMSQELHGTKIGHCEDQLEFSKEKLSNTHDLVATLSNRSDEVKNKQAILEVSKNYYEQELANLNYVREKNLQRLKRYFDLTVNAYNYLYLDNFKVDGEAVPYYEGDFYKENIELLRDLILEITALNDLLNPNRSFVVYDLKPDQLEVLQDSDFRKRDLNIRLDTNDFFCQGFGLDDQARVMIEKVGVLLDIDPSKEHLFFQNSNKRSTKINLTHGAENRFFDFQGNEVEYWTPAQKRKVSAYSSRILVDANSDYQELRDSRFFERLSFRKTSFSSTWGIKMNDPSIKMYEDSDTTYSNPLLKGVKLVFWLNSTETQGDLSINRCLPPPNTLQAVYSSSPSEKVDLTWEFDTEDDDYNSIDQFQIYRSESSNKGFEKIGQLDIDDPNCSVSTTTLSCSFEDDMTGVSGKTYYYHIRSSYQSEDKTGNFRSGIKSEEVSVAIP